MVYVIISSNNYLSRNVLSSPSGGFWVDILQQRSLGSKNYSQYFNQRWSANKLSYPILISSNSENGAYKGNNINVANNAEYLALFKLHLLDHVYIFVFVVLDMYSYGRWNCFFLFTM
ncbi:Hypothetical_protein [Hexamita inflata]|uniref:Hypothetical_protein n=1 Tax=Hexamita inflata TaxID=28002 RepID=A0AA86R2L2_9EUKA|nr:Hypothetical protein HINF_LOCUS58219 [Hexamita inflata]